VRCRYILRYTSGRYDTNGTKLNIIGTARAENGKLWGETVYNDVCGWVFLGQCSENPPQQTSTDNTSSSSQASDTTPSTVSKSETSSSVNAAPSQASTEKSGDDNSYTPAPVSSETEPDIADYDSTLASDSETAGTQTESVSSPTFILALIIIMLLIIIVVLTAFLVLQGRKRNNL
jgi:cobalamin biosynthesis Mg chelatase CobN